MGTLFIDAGLLRRRARLETADRADDGMGGAAETWRELAELSVHVEPVALRERERFGQGEAVATHRVICRFREDVERGMRFRLGGRALVIRSVHDPDESQRFLLCRCEEER